jgi:hypothetical protein
MRQYSRTVRVGAVYFSLLSAVLLSVRVYSAPASELSKWLSKQAIPELRERLGRHPRYQGQTVAVRSTQEDALSAAIVSVVLRSFPGQYGTVVQSYRFAPAPEASAARSIDHISCAAVPGFDYVVQVAAGRSSAGIETVKLQLVSTRDVSEVSAAWRWRGRLNRAERQYLQTVSSNAGRDGSLSAPWSASDVETAATNLSREFACGLRSQIGEQLTLRWNASPTMPGVLSDTVAISRHLLGNLRELGVWEASDEPGTVNYSVDTRLVPLQDDIWQLWLIGAPRQEGMAPVQAVSYFRLSGQEQATASPALPGLAPPPGENPAEFLDVKLLDATQSDKGRSRASLQAILQLSNRSAFPMAYSFTLSGGHFNHCLASPDYYRHDRYGTVTGTLAGGETVVRRLQIDNAKHQPKTIFAMRKCAGFRDLDAFEEFPLRGHTVTDYLRWQM